MTITNIGLNMTFSLSWYWSVDRDRPLFQAVGVQVACGDDLFVVVILFKYVVIAGANYFSYDLSVVEGRPFAVLVLEFGVFELDDVAGQDRFAGLERPSPNDGLTGLLGGAGAGDL